MRYLYLHGLASGPESAKAKYFRDRFRSRGLVLDRLDFNQPRFASLTLTRQIKQVESCLGSTPEPATLIGSSLGGLTAAWVAQRQSRVERIILLAPAFDFLSVWLSAIGRSQVQTWRQVGEIPIYHHAYRRMEALEYGIVRDLEQYDEDGLTRSVPTLILHGVGDQTIPIDASRCYAETRPWVDLIELESDHALGNSVSRIWQALQDVCQLPKG